MQRKCHGYNNGAVLDFLVYFVTSAGQGLRSVVVLLAEKHLALFARVSRPRPHFLAVSPGNSLSMGGVLAWRFRENVRQPKVTLCYIGLSRNRPYGRGLTVSRYERVHTF